MLSAYALWPILPRHIRGLVMGQRLQVSLQRQIVDGEWVDSSTQPMKHKTRINEACDTMHACASAHVYVCAPMNKCGCAMLTSPISNGFVDAWYLGPGVYGPL